MISLLIRKAEFVGLDFHLTQANLGQRQCQPGVWAVTEWVPGTCSSSPVRLRHSQPLYIMRQTEGTVLQGEDAGFEVWGLCV